MSKRAHGRGAIAAIGFLLVFAGLVGGGVLWYLAAQEPDRAADEFARAAAGCTTTIAFTEAREYFVFEELSGVAVTVAGCEPTTTPGQPFAFVVRDPTGEPVPTVADTSVAYELDAGQGQSVARIAISDAGEYSFSVVGSDPAVVAAIGPDPEAGVADLRRAAIAAAAVGLVLGGLLLWAAGRRSRRAATFGSPLDPGWGVTERDHERRAAANAESGSPFEPPDARQVPVNPHQPDERRVAGRPVASDPFEFGWAPPTGSTPVDPTAAPEPPTDVVDVDVDVVGVVDVEAGVVDESPADTAATDAGLDLGSGVDPDHPAGVEVSEAPAVDVPVWDVERGNAPTPDEAAPAAEGDALRDDERDNERDDERDDTERDDRATP